MLVPVGVQAVLMAFRTGSHVAKLADRLSPAVGRSESWTYIFPSQKEEETRKVLAEFCRNKVRSFPVCAPARDVSENLRTKN